MTLQLKGMNGRSGIVRFSPGIAMPGKPLKTMDGSGTDNSAVKHN
jgi:hypothetical protein